MEPNPREHLPWPVWWQRPLIASRALWFYFQDLMWPANLMPIYPRWDLQSIFGSGLVFMFSAFVAAAALCGFHRRIGRAPAGLILFFAATLGPVLGLIDYGFMKYSFVADRFQYLASLGPIILFAALVERMIRGLPRLGSLFPVAFSGTLLLALGILTWRLGWIYFDDGALFSYNLSKNPSAWPARFGLGNFDVEQGRPDDAMKEYLEALRINSKDASTMLNVGNLYYQRKDYAEAEKWFVQALELDSHHARLNNNMGAALLAQNRRRDAMRYFTSGVDLQPDNPEFRYNLALCYYDERRFEEAIAQFQAVLKASPGHSDARRFIEQAEAMMRKQTAKPK
jgi:tetratricopeptide (TPR) repeat protein